MKVRCYGCDPKGQRSIDKDKDDYIHTQSKKYYHVDCYKKHLKEKGKDEETINNIILDLKNKMQDIANEKLQEQKEKDEFYNYLKNYYNISTIPTSFYIRIANIRSGTYKTALEPISYFSLLEIYQIMSNKLNKIATKKQFNSINQRLFWDLAIVLNNYNDYKNWKAKQESSHKQVIENLIKEGKKIDQIKNKENEKQSNNDFNILDAIDELIL